MGRRKKYFTTTDDEKTGASNDESSKHLNVSRVGDQDNLSKLLHVHVKNGKSTSSIPGVSIADVRKNLTEVREMIDDLNNVFNFQNKLSNGMEVWSFVHKLALGLHNKRLYKKKKNCVD